jgi:hypothetical protein
MPVAFEVTFTGRLAASDDVWATFAGDVLNDDYAVPTFTGTVGSSVVDSWDGDSIYTRVRVRLAGAWIPEEDLVLPFKAHESIDSHMTTWSLALRGKRYSIFRTVTTWTRVAIDVFLDHGQPGAFQVAATPTYSGYVRKCDQDQGSPGPVVRLQCGDRAALYDRFEACAEVPPLQGLTRDAIVRMHLEAAGITEVDCPEGAVYNKALQWTNKRLFQVLGPFLEPEGWHFRFLPDGTAQIYTAELKTAPQPPDDVWYVEDLLEPPKAVPPEAVPSRYVLTATAVRLVDELGVETTVTKTTVRALYAPVVAVESQTVTGTFNPTGLSPLPEVERIVSVITDQVAKRGSAVLSQVTTEEGWFNPAGAYQVSTGSGGFSFIAGRYRTAEGDFVTWLTQKFTEIGRRDSRHFYNLNGDLTGSTIDTWKYHRHGTRGVATVASYPTYNVAGSYLYQDDQSYFSAAETYSIAERQVVRLVYDEATGAQLSESQDSYRWYSPASAIDGNPGWYVLYDGTGQKDLNATLMLVETRTRQHILSRDALIRGEQEVIYGFSAPRKVDGSFDFGDFKSDADEMALRFSRIESTEYNVLAEDQYEKVTYTPAGGRVARVFLGSLPITRYTQSVWTRMVQEPLELSIDDPTAEEWFGFSRQTISHEHVQDLEEAARVIENERRRAMSNKVEVLRPATGRKVGDTILLIDPDQGLFARGLVVDVEPTWDGIGAEELYRLEVPL